MKLFDLEKMRYFSAEAVCVGVCVRVRARLCLCVCLRVSPCLRSCFFVKVSIIRTTSGARTKLPTASETRWQVMDAFRAHHINVVDLIVLALLSSTFFQAMP